MSEAGADWCSLITVDLASGDVVPDAVVRTKGLPPAWLPDGRTFVHSRPVEADAEHSEGAVGSWNVFVHRVGDPAEDDVPLFGELPENSLFHPLVTSHDGKWLIVTEMKGGSWQNQCLWLFPLSTVDGGTAIGTPAPLLAETTARFGFVRALENSLVVNTTLGAPRGRLISIDVDRSVTEGGLSFGELIPEAETVLEGAVAAGEELITIRIEGGSTRLDRHSLDGAPIGGLDLPPGGLVDHGMLALTASPDRAEFFIGWSTLTEAQTVLTGRTGTDRLDPVASSGGGLDVQIETRHAESKDGTLVPYHVARLAGSPPTPTPSPTLLYEYGGFGVSLHLDHHEALAAWLDAGGTLVVANLRGGGEFGEAWHDAGRLDRKQNVFDDCIAVAEDLIATGVTTQRQLALHGSSNGGLLVSAVITQRPDLVGVALPDVGVHDMLRYHRFTAGAAWKEDYGDPDDPAALEYLLRYSPVHNATPRHYPATLLTTGDHDDRVVPAHSYKMTAALQHAQRGAAPILLRVATGTGHGAGKSVTQTIDDTAALLSFAAHHTGLTEPVVTAHRP